MLYHDLQLIQIAVPYHMKQRFFANISTQIDSQYIKSVNHCLPNCDKIMEPHLNIACVLLMLAGY